MKRLLLLFFLLILSTNFIFASEFILENDIADIINNLNLSFNDTSDEEFEKIEVLNATFDYTPSEFCQSDIDPIANVTTPGGTFTSTAGLVFTNSITGEIDLSSSTPGTYSVTYTVASGSPLTFMQNITIHSSDPATITYNSSGTTSTTLCKSGSNPTPTITGVTGGEFTSSPTGLVFVGGGGGGSDFGIDLTNKRVRSAVISKMISSTGQVDLNASTVGEYIVEYTTPGGCVIASHAVKIVNTLDPDFSYSSSDYCSDDINPVVPILSEIKPESAGQVFLAGAGLAMNASTGVISPGSSSPGAYFVRRFVTNNCQGGTSSSNVFQVNIVSSGNTSFTYQSTSFCKTDTNPVATISGTAGGTFTSTDANLIFANANTGEIDLGATPIGTYPIVYELTGNCAATSASQNITITGADTSFSYTSIEYCSDSTDPLPTITGTTGGTFSNSSASGLSINSTSGIIDISASALGAHEITYTITGACTASSTFNITITTASIATFNYSSSTYCKSGSNPVPSITGTSGGVFSSADANLVFANTSTGEIDLVSSLNGVYSIIYQISGTCGATSAPQNITITSENATFNYTTTNYCSGDSDPLPVITGTTGGTFTNSSSSGLSINSGTGLIDLDGSTTGNHEITYTTPGLCAVTSTFDITITVSGVAEFNYASSTYCKSDSNPVPSITGTTGGVFSSTDVNLVFSDINTGEIDLATTPLGVYPIIYELSGSCGATSTSQDITIIEENASFSYTNIDYCSGDSDPLPAITGTTGGTFINSSSSGLSINSGTGLIDLDASTTGSHEITYTTPGLCGVTSTFDITITTNSAADFNYSSSVFCEADSNPVPSVTGTSRGLFSSTTGLVFANTGTGEIDLSATTPGMYTIDYVIAGLCGITVQKDITIDSENPTLSFETSIDDAMYLSNPAESINVEIGRKLELRFPESFNGTVSWVGPNSFSGTGSEIVVSNSIQMLDSGTYTATVTFDLNCGSAPTVYNFSVNALNNVVRVSPKVFLQGAMLGSADNLMRDDLRVSGYLPNDTPYSDGISVDGTIFNDAAVDDDDIVDWVFIELRDATTNTTILDSQSAFVQRDGDIVDVNGNPEITMTATSGGSYFVVVKHRNHLGIMTNAAIALDVTTTVLDFRDGSQNTNGSNAQTSNGMPVGTVGMWAGDATQNGTINIIGSPNDSVFIRDTVLNDPINLAIQFYGFSVSGYNNADVNMNGQTNIVGIGNDANVIRDNILNHPINIFIQFYGFTITGQIP